MNRRTFLTTTTAAGLTTTAAAGLARVASAQSVPDAIRNLRPMTDGIQPITDDERRGASRRRAS